MGFSPLNAEADAAVDEFLCSVEVVPFVVDDGQVDVGIAGDGQWLAGWLRAETAADHAIGAAITAYILGILLNQQQDNAAAWRSEIRRRLSEPES